MAGKLSKFLSYIGIEEAGDNDEEEYYPEDEQQYGSARDGEPRESRDNRDTRDTKEDRKEHGFTFDRNKRGSHSDDVEEVQSNRMPAKEQKAKAAPQPSQSPNTKMIVYHPVSFEDSQIIIDCLRDGKGVVVNISEIDTTSAIRILDFLSGGVYALDGTMCKISNGIFIVSPTSMDVVNYQDNDPSEIEQE